MLLVGRHPYIPLNIGSDWVAWAVSASQTEDVDRCPLVLAGIEEGSGGGCWLRRAALCIGADDAGLTAVVLAVGALMVCVGL